MQLTLVDYGGIEAGQLLLPAGLTSSVLLRLVVDVCGKDTIYIHCWALPDNDWTVVHDQDVEQWQASPVCAVAAQVCVDVVSGTNWVVDARERPVPIEHWSAPVVVSL